METLFIPQALHPSLKGVTGSKYTNDNFWFDLLKPTTLDKAKKKINEERYIQRPQTTWGDFRIKIIKIK